MKNKIWKMVVKDIKDEKVIQKSIINGIALGTGIIAYMILVLILISIRKQMFM
ncbi:MAG: hypothetical protein GX366_05875 [Epulopiscium sp.]|nr:hypothetical protein [Candidatus Epulonipiscium sp.]